MKNELHQHPDGSVYIRVGDKVYQDSQDNFQLDAGVTLPDLPEGAIERIYTQGVRHAIQDETSVIAGGPLPWELGDDVIANIDAILAAQAARQPEPQPQRPNA